MSASTSRPRRTALETISYRDDSTDEDTSSTPPIRSSQRLQVPKPTPTSLDAGIDIFEERSQRNPRHRQAKVSLRSRPLINRFPPSESSNENSEESPYQNRPPEKPKLTANPKQSTKPSKDKKRRPLNPRPLNKGLLDSYKRRKLNDQASGKAGKTAIGDIHDVHAMPEVKIPPWQTLPYQILLCTFQYASYPLYQDASHDTGSTEWLMRVSKLCRSFHDAAISALLHSPPLFPAYRAHGLVRLLHADQETLSTSYTNKVKRLDVEVQHLLIRKSGIDLAHLIRQTPLLKSLHLYHNYDRVGAYSWIQPHSSTGRSWSYPLELFDAMDNNRIQLNEWSWNGRFPGYKGVLDQMEVLHARDCLRDLTSLSILNLETSRKDDAQEKVLARKRLGEAINALPKLRNLSLENCNLVDGAVLISLPSHLRSLTIANCIGFDSTDLLLYLTDHGFWLKELVLVGNQGLDLGFALDLEALCPYLRLFKMNFTYTDPSSFHDVEPHFAAAFPEGLMPTWPRSLQAIVIENLRNLDIFDAEEFFKSLISVASELKDLRKISVRILLQDDGWRERAQLRQKWMPKLEEVFLRKAASPEPFVPTARRRRMEEVEHPGMIDQTSVAKQHTITQIGRKSTRIAKQSETRTDPTRAKNSGRPPSPILDEEIAENYSEELDISPDHQAMCEQVILHIDGQRPATEQFKEADFLDEEKSGDEEWNGRDIDFDLDFDGAQRSGRGKAQGARKGKGRKKS